MNNPFYTTPSHHINFDSFPDSSCSREEHGTMNNLLLQAAVFSVFCMVICATETALYSASGPPKKNTLQQECVVDNLCTHEREVNLRLVSKHYPTVDLFYMYSESNTLVYMRDGYYWTMPSVASKFANFNHRTNTSDIRIHLFVDSDSMLEESKAKEYYAHDTRLFIQKYAYYKDLIRRTVTSLEYELTIFRWRMYNEVVSTWNAMHAPSEQIERILCLDGDVLMAMSPAKFYHDVVDTFRYNATIARNNTTQSTVHGLSSNSSNSSYETRHELINMGYGVVGLFTAHGLSAFDVYITDWYTGTDEEVLARSLKEGGGKYWSDMMLLEAFLSRNGTDTSIRNNCFEFDRYLRYWEGWRADPASQCLLQALQCVPMPNYKEQAYQWGLHFHIDNLRWTGTTHRHKFLGHKRNLSIQGPMEKYPYCFMVKKYISSLICCSPTQWLLYTDHLLILNPCIIAFIHSTSKEASKRVSCTRTVECSRYCSTKHITSAPFVRRTPRNPSSKVLHL